jgi:hypothetical protein
MKKVNVFILACLLSVLSIGQSGCYGPFKLTKNLHEWNSTVGDKFTNALVFFAFVIIPVYEVAVLVDGLVLNTIEFWSGDNPIAMNENDKDVQIVKKDGKKYRITATKNKFFIEQIKGPEKGQFAELIYNPEDQSWSLKDGDKELQKLVIVDDQANVVKVFRPDGQVVEFDQNHMNLALIKSQLKAESQQWTKK